MVCGINDTYVLTDLWKGYFYQIVLNDMIKIIIKRTFRNIMFDLLYKTLEIRNLLDNSLNVCDYTIDLKYRSKIMISDWGNDIYGKDNETHNKYIYNAMIKRPLGRKGGWNIIISRWHISLDNLAKIRRNNMKWLREHNH